MKNSNLNVLAKQLFDDLNKDLDFFKTKTVIVPSKKMESFLKTYYLKNKDTVLMNVSIINKRNGLFNLFDTNYSLANNHQIKSIIIKYLFNHKNNAFRDYLKAEGKQQGIKIYDIASALTKTFIDFEDENNIADYEDIYEYLIKELKTNNLTTMKNIFDECSFKNIGDIYVFGFNEYLPLDLQIIQKYQNETNNNVFKYDLVHQPLNNFDIDLIKAPSKIREIEHIHSIICNKLLTDEKAKYSDFLVIGSNIQEYENEIARVFNQHDEKYPNIPYYINTIKTKNNDVLNALKIINKIVNEGFFTRLDFDNLINNNIIKKARGILDTDIDSWRNAVIDMNVYRKDDWDYAKKRILAYKFCDNVDDSEILIENKTYVPYSRIGLDDDSIVRFSMFIDDLERIINDLSKPTIDLTNLETLKEELSCLFSIKDNNGTETNSYLKHLLSIVDFWIRNNIIDLPTNILINTLIDVSKRSGFNNGELYTSGVSFTDFTTNVILPTKYLFIINASSKNLPIKKFKDPLNKQEISYEKDQEAFELFIENAEEIYISYVYRDLKTDEEFYLSNFVKNLDCPKIKEIKEKANGDFKEENIDKLTIDEDRPWQEVFTKREYKNKNYKKSLIYKADIKEKNAKAEIDESVSQIPTSITVLDLGKFLDEPLQAKTNKLLKISDEIEETIEDEFEPFSLKKWKMDDLYKELLIEIINNDVTNKVDLKKLGEKIKHEFNLKKRIPWVNDLINDSVFNELLYEAYDKKIKYEKDGNCEIIKLPDLKLKTVVGKQEIEWVLRCRNEFIKIHCGNEVKYRKITLETPKQKDHFMLYAISLMDLVLINDNKMHTINIKDKGTKTSHIIFTIDCKTAKTYLDLIYNKYIDYSINRYFPFKLIESGNPNYYSMRADFKYNVTSSNYSIKGKIYNTDRDLGYNEETFEQEFEDMRREQYKLLCYVNESEANDDGE